MTASLFPNVILACNFPMKGDRTFKLLHESWNECALGMIITELQGCGWMGSLIS